MNGLALIVVAPLWFAQGEPAKLVFYDRVTRDRVPNVRYQAYQEKPFKRLFPEKRTADENGEDTTDLIPDVLSEILVAPTAEGYAGPVHAYRDEHGVFQVPLKRSKIPTSYQESFVCEWIPGYGWVRVPFRHTRFTVEGPYYYTAPPRFYRWRQYRIHEPLFR